MRILIKKKLEVYLLPRTWYTFSPDEPRKSPEYRDDPKKGKVHIIERTVKTGPKRADRHNREKKYPQSRKAK